MPLYGIWGGGGVVVWGGCGRFLFHKPSLFVNIKIIVSMNCMGRKKEKRN